MFGFPPQSPRSGYSLVETLVAFAILAMFLTALMPGSARLLGRANSGLAEAIALDFALSEFDRLWVTNGPRQKPGTYSYRNWTVKVSSSPADLGVNFEVREISIEITDKHSRTLAKVDGLFF